MIDLDEFYKGLKSNKLKNCCIFCGIDEELIKESIEAIVSKNIEETFKDLNLVRFDGNTLSFSDLFNGCETLPFMSEKKVITVYRAEFLKDKSPKDTSKLFEDLHNYIKDLPDYCILILYYVYEDEREKPSNRVKKLDKLCSVVKVDKLKGDRLQKKVHSEFTYRGKDIGKIELKFFCDSIENNMSIIKNEIEKLIAYTEDRDIKKEDIIKLLPQKNDNDIFDLVDYLSQKKPEKALDILNELVFRGENLLGILFMIQRQFKLLFNIKLLLKEGANKDVIVRELKLNPYIAEKMISQSSRFNLKQLKSCLEICLNTERTLKTSSSDKKTEMELLIVNTMRA